MKVDAIAKPDGPTVKAMNAALAKAPARPVIKGGIRPATTDTAFKNERTVRGMGGYVDSGDYPAFMASALYSRDGHTAAPEVADLLKQTTELNPPQGSHMRTRLAELLDPIDMEKIEMAAGMAPNDRAMARPADADTLAGGSGAEKLEQPNGSGRDPERRELPPPTDQPIDPEKLRSALDYKNFGLGDRANAALLGPVFAARAKSLSETAKHSTAKAFPGQRTHNDEADAFRHALWSFKMARELNPHASKKIGDSHERRPNRAYEDREKYVPAPEGEKLMDLYNNHVGRELERETRNDPRPAEDIILEALRGGRLQTSPFVLSR